MLYVTQPTILQSYTMPTHTTKSKHDRNKVVPVRQKKIKKFLKGYTRSSCSRKLIQDSMAQCDDIITEAPNKRFKPRWAFWGCTAGREKEKRERHHSSDAPYAKVTVGEPKEPKEPKVRGSKQEINWSAARDKKVNWSAVIRDGWNTNTMCSGWTASMTRAWVQQRPDSAHSLWTKARREQWKRDVEKEIAVREEPRLRLLRHRGIMRCAPMLMLWRKRATETVYHPDNIDFARIMSED